MQIIGRNLPKLQNAIDSGFENAGAGIVEAARRTGISGLDSAFELFSASSLGAPTDPASLTSVAGAAEYSDPVESLKSEQNQMPASTEQNGDILEALQDRTFRPEVELADLTRADNATAIDSPLATPLDDVSKPLRPGPGRSYVSEVLQGAGDSALPGGSFDQYNTSVERPTKIDHGSSWIQGPLNPINQVRIPVSEPNTSVEKPATIDQGSPWIQGPLNPINQVRIPVSEAHTTVEGRGARWMVGHPAPNSSGASGVSDQLAERGIIIVGGGTDPTYFGTIDDTVQSLQTNPGPDAQLMLQAQLAAINDMTSAASQTLDLYRQLNSNSPFHAGGIAGKVRIRA
jgi:hypothetical protein